MGMLRDSNSKLSWVLRCYASITQFMISNSIWFIVFMYMISKLFIFCIIVLYLYMCTCSSQEMLSTSTNSQQLHCGSCCWLLSLSVIAGNCSSQEGFRYKIESSYRAALPSYSAGSESGSNLYVGHWILDVIPWYQRWSSQILAI